jgi:hypothetical protein
MIYYMYIYIALKHYENAAKDLLVTLPMGVDELDSTHRKLEQESMKLFQKDAMGDGQVFTIVRIYDVCLCVCVCVCVCVDMCVYNTHTHVY